MSACVPSMAGVADIPSANASAADSKNNLVARAQAGDGEAFGVLFEQHKKRVYSLCLLMTGDVADAEDLTQDAFIQVFRKLGTFRGDSAFSTWLYRVAVNTVADESPVSASRNRFLWTSRFASIMPWSRAIWQKRS